MFKSRMPSYKTARDLDAGLPPAQGWIHALRAVCGISQDELAKRLGRNRASLSRLERSELDRRVSMVSLDEAAAALGCKVEVRLVASKSFEAMADQRLAEINRERKEMRKPRLRKPVPRENPAEPTEAEAEWDHRQFPFGMQRGLNTLRNRED